MRLRGVGHRFPGAGWLFRGLDHDFAPGTVTALSGPSGCGKSTLLAIVAGSQAPAEGRVERDDVARVGWVLQNPHGSARRAALDHVVLPLLARGVVRQDAEVAAAGVMSRFGIGHVGGRAFGQLSGGEAQRLMLARAVAAAPDLLLVDEPTAQLDQPTAVTVAKTLGRLADEGCIVLVATHDPHARGACHAVVELGTA